MTPLAELFFDELAKSVEEIAQFRFNRAWRSSFGQVVEAFGDQNYTLTEAQHAQLAESKLRFSDLALPVIRESAARDVVRGAVRAIAEYVPGETPFGYGAALRNPGKVDTPS